MEVSSLARQHTVKMIQVLHGIATQENAPVASRVAAAEAILDRGWGRPKQTLAADPDGPLIVEIIQRVREPKMKTELEVRRELKAVQAQLRRARADGEPCDMAYGAQQALTWMLGTGMAASEVEEIIAMAAAMIEEQAASQSSAEACLVRKSGEAFP